MCGKNGTGCVEKIGPGMEKNKTGGTKLGQGVIVKMKQEVGIIAKRYTIRLCFFL